MFDKVLESPYQVIKLFFWPDLPETYFTSLFLPLTKGINLYSRPRLSSDIFLKLTQSPKQGVKMYCRPRHTLNMSDKLPQSPNQGIKLFSLAQMYTRGMVDKLFSSIYLGDVAKVCFAVTFEPMLQFL